MIGAIIGDISGSTYEFSANKRISAPLFPLGSDFTDDTVMTIATASAILGGRDYRCAYVDHGHRFPYPMGGYGAGFRSWLREPDPMPYRSWGNGSAMRVSPIGWAFSTLDEVLREAERSAAVSHNHPEGIKGAQATATAIWLARTGSSKEEIRADISSRFGYDLSRSADEVRIDYAFNESCQRTVPESITAFLDSSDFESAIRLAISLGGDADTVGCITGAIAEAFYREIPIEMIGEAESRMPAEFLTVLSEFEELYGPRKKTA
jgi:ADP-ribosyl-[dinitrogen reductase] hydrolase